MPGLSGLVLLALCLNLHTCRVLPDQLPGLSTAPPGRVPLPDPLGGCGPCEPDLCPQTRGCRAGLVPDPCGCCTECGNLERQTCDQGDRSIFYGLCGTGMRCLADPRGGGGGAEGEQEEQDEALLLVFLCEVFAFPMALVEWRKEGGAAVLPGDDPHLSVQSRGGPLKFEVSSWLQIEGAEPEDSGTYRCIARNNMGSVSATAVLGVLGAEELSSYLANSVSEMKHLMNYDQDLY
ncbi:Kazal-type serine protease inhibitor domain-containing protein 1 [Liparis tanakae]|uniref:Kazal-type serine protease inhibitor domain-containing protein 1 n=1 Tax=Liparis tanakae TaxID=230148 RepID=A0A4Z2ETF4_9TELE|nr:Kazal-type serine protease inhibitor domain-containing protein 1 [Liparis tanakae]